MYSCIWCKCPSDKRHDLSKEWSISDVNKGARSTSENVAIGSSSRKRYNVSHPPLFPNIPLTNVVIDNLHLFLRVTDVLINQLILELKRQDSIERMKTFSSYDPSKYRHIHGYEQFVSSLKIPDFHFYIGQTSKALKCRSLTGPEKLKLISNISIASLLPGLPSEKTQPIQNLWSDLLELNRIFSRRQEDLSTKDIDEFHEQSRKWGRDFIKVYHIQNVTPYIHAMVNHVSEFMRVHGSILPFTQQGLEKYNDVTTKMYFRSTCHQGSKAFTQILQKQNRLEHFRDIGIKTKKCFEVTCSKCNERGHYSLTCKLNV